MALAAVLAILAALAGPALADDPFRLDSDLVDRVGAVSGREAEVKAAQDGLATDGLQLWVVYVADFSGRNAADWADETAAKSDLGTRDVLLAVATEERSYWLSVDADAPVSDAEVSAITVDTERYLSVGDWAGAAVATASGLSAAVGGNLPTAGPIVTPGPDQPKPGESGGADLTIVILLVIGVIAVVAVGFVLPPAAGRRRQARSPGGPGTRCPGPWKQRSRRSTRRSWSRGRTPSWSRPTMRSATRSRSSASPRPSSRPRRWLPSGPRSTRPGRTLNAAFAIRQRLDDSEKEEPAERRAMLEELVVRCERSQRALDAEKDRFDQLRDVERRAPELLAAMPARLAELEQELEAARIDDAALAAYAESNRAPVVGHVVEAEKRLAVARQAIAEGSAAVEKGDTILAGRGARLAEGSLGQAKDLIAAVRNLRQTLDESRGRVAAELDQAEPELARAEGSIAGGAAGGANLAARLAEAKQLVASARARLAQPQPDVVAALADAKRANEIGDELLAGLRTAQETAARSAAALEGAIRDAQLAISRASDLVATRRSGIGGQARTRLVEAERRLDAAVSLGPTDPAAALVEAQAATRLANESYRDASRDIGGPGMGGASAGRRWAAGDPISPERSSAASSAG